MQIVRDLGGYSLGRSDLVRRAMSKKKTSVMEKERQNFIYGNPEEGVCGCINNGIDERTADTIYNEMMDFAKYAFNKSHAAAYAVVSYQTAWLKYYYPAEYMAALLNSILDNLTKISNYILTCRQMGLKILPPDINEGDQGFTASGKNIRYGLSGIKNVGRNVVAAIIEERNKNGAFRSLKDFIDRCGGREVNKRTIENFIKSGAMDSLPGTRKQKMLTYPSLLDQKSRDEKTGISGQMSLFDLFSSHDDMVEEDFPDVGEFDKDVFLNFEKECLGIYVSGHPMESWQKVWESQITNTFADFELDDETGMPKVRDKSRVTVGGIVNEKTVKLTSKNQRMAYLQIEDLTGVGEVVVFSNNLEAYEKYMEKESRLFIRGRVDAADGKAAKLICEKVIPLSEIPRRIWIRCQDKEVWYAKEKALYDILDRNRGNSSVMIYLEKERARKLLPMRWNVSADDAVIADISGLFGENNVKVVEIPIEKKA